MENLNKNKNSGTNKEKEVDSGSDDGTKADQVHKYVWEKVSALDPFAKRCRLSKSPMRGQRSSSFGEVESKIQKPHSEVRVDGNVGDKTGEESGKANEEARVTSREIGGVPLGPKEDKRETGGVEAIEIEDDMDPFDSSYMECEEGKEGKRKRKAPTQPKPDLTTQKHKMKFLEECTGCPRVSSPSNYLGKYI